MKRLFVYLSLAASTSLFFSGCSDKSSPEACRHEVTMNLDKGNFDAVLAASCADSMQKGAANFGKAGFDIKDVINRFIDAGVVSGQTVTNDLTVYMDGLIGTVTPTSLVLLDQSKAEYEIVCDSTPTTEPAWKDATFYEGLVDSIKALSLLKTVIDSSGLGTLSSCDGNGNGVPDEVDATSCALVASTVINNEAPDANCKGAAYSRSTPVDLSLTDAGGNPVPGTFSGLTITITGSTIQGCAGSYHKLLYKDDSGRYFAATTTSDQCTDQAGNHWPCPLPGPNVDLVATIDQTLTSAQNALTASLTGTESSDMKTALQDIRGEACCGCTSSPCPPCTSPCTSQNIADYLQTINK